MRLRTALPSVVVVAVTLALTACAAAGPTPSAGCDALTFTGCTGSSATKAAAGATQTETCLAAASLIWKATDYMELGMSATDAASMHPFVDRIEGLIPQLRTTADAAGEASAVTASRIQDVADRQKSWVAAARAVLAGTSTTLSTASSRWLLTMDDFNDSCDGVLDK